MKTEAELREDFKVPQSTTLGSNGYGWLRVLDRAVFKKQLDDAGYFRISSTELKAISGREPRLMAKHDSSAARPWIFKELGLNIIPLSRFEYLVGKFDLFAKFPADDALGPVRFIPFPDGIESLSPANLTSEAAALNASSLSGILDDFLGVDPLHATVAGRMSSGEISLRLACGEFEISKAQMEIDAGLESSELLCLVEAKNHLSDDFNIRQLYFPYRRFANAISKQVVPVYLVYSNGVYFLYEFEFLDDLRPESIHFRRGARYTFTASELSLDVIAQLLKSVQVLREPDCPFPQANSLARVINLCELLQEGPLGAAEITEEYEFTPRQTRYYAGAAQYLELVTEDSRSWSLTQFGTVVMNAARNDRNIEIIKALLRHQVFHSVLSKTLESNKVPDQDSIMKIMIASNLGLGAKTLKRRAGTVMSWAQWVWELATTPELQI